MKRFVLIAAAIIFIEFIGLTAFKNNIFDKNIENEYESYDFLRASTVNFAERNEKIEFDEDYAINMAINLYEQIYGKKYSKEDFCVDDIYWINTCWNVCLKSTKKQYSDEPKGLVIDKNNGGILVNLGEYAT